jgi:hypothetical protein
MRLLSTLLLLIIPSIAMAQNDSTSAGIILLTGFGGATFGNVKLGVSHSADVQQILGNLGGLGSKRENNVDFIVGTDTIHPRELYNPPATMNQLYFENNILVMIVEGIPHNLPASKTQFIDKYPTARETRRESGWYELQTQISGCVWLIAVFNAADDKLESDAYAYTCKGNH